MENPPIIDAVSTPKVQHRINRQNTGAAPKIRKLKLRYPELSQKQIADRVGCDPANVYRVLKRFMGKKQSDADLREFQDQKANIYDSLQHRALMSITDGKLAKSGLRDLALAAGLWEDKARTIRGQANSINVNVLVDAAKLVREMDERDQ